VLKWDVPVDNNYHPIGAGPVVHVACQGSPYIVQVWTEDSASGHRAARVYGTGQPVPDDDVHLGSVLAGPFVWHVYASPDDAPVSIGDHGSQRDGWPG
jgi:hypothetical protein